MVRVSDLHLEQYVLGELSAQERDRVRDAIAADESVRARYEALERSNEEILSAYPPGEIVALIQERTRSAEPSFRRAPPYMTYLLPAAAALLLFVSAYTVRDRIFPQLAGASRQEVTRVKAATHLSIFRKTAAGAEELAGGSGVRRGDVLQIGYTAGDMKYGAIFSIDGRGVVTFHLPENYRGQTLVAPVLDEKGQTVLPFAYELDDAPGFERFFFVFSHSRFDVRDIEKAARTLSSNPQAADNASLRLPSGLNVYSLVLKKLG
jgi:hypothetical protein